MKINLIIKLSIIFYATALFGTDKEQIIKKVVSYTKDQKTPSTEYILNALEDKRLQIDPGVLERFKNKPEKIKTYEEYKKIFFNKQRIDGGVSFYKKYKTLIARAAKEFETDPIVLVAIVGVETNYGLKPPPRIFLRWRRQWRLLGSIAFYLTENGYPKNDFNFSYKSKAWRAVRTYNRSDKYANIIIDLRNEIAKNIFLLD